MQRSLTRWRFGAKREQPHRWLVLLDYLFYILVIAAVGFFAYYLYHYRSTITLILPLLLQGTIATIVISVISMLLAVIFGLVGALGRLSSFVPFRWLATLYTELVRGTPILVQLLLWYYGVGILLSNLGFDPYLVAFQIMTPLQSNSLVPSDLSTYFYGIIGLSFNYGAYLTEVFRSGIQGVEVGQTEAALSLGLSPRQTMRRVILPQAIRLTLPPFTNNFITLVQDSALLSVIAVAELEQTTSSFAYPQTDPGTKLFIFVLGSLIYLAICYPLSLLSRHLEKRLGVAY